MRVSLVNELQGRILEANQQRKVYGEGVEILGYTNLISVMELEVICLELWYFI